ncbi:MAG TPA: insulinase family protein, partial [Bryobacteraceae bacterium]|nr:insulinase family protein [Bryobacteraceae bacterium]
MNAVLGGLFGSRINLNLREAHGYTYGASSFYDWRRGPGPFVVSTAVQSDVTAPALREILLEIDRIRSDRISEDELLLARDYLEGVFPIRYETTAAIASALATLVIYDLPADYFESYRKNVRAVSSEAVLRAARSHLHPDELQTIIVGDARLIRGAVSDLSVGDVQVHST